MPDTTENSQLANLSKDSNLTDQKQKIPIIIYGGAFGLGLITALTMYIYKVNPGIAGAMGGAITLTGSSVPALIKLSSDASARKKEDDKNNQKIIMEAYTKQNLAEVKLFATQTIDEKFKALEDGVNKLIVVVGETNNKVELMNGELKNFRNEVNNKFDEVNNKFDAINGELKNFRNEVNNKFDEVNNKFDEVNNKFDEVNNKFDAINGDLKNFRFEVNNKFDEVNNKFDEVNNKFDAINGDLKNFRFEVNNKFDEVNGNIERASTETHNQIEGLKIYIDRQNISVISRLNILEQDVETLKNQKNH
jgi:uncharacterized phage infection (PIP) family protein YhgE